MVLVKLTKNQIKKISDIISDLGLVTLASFVIPSLLGKFQLNDILLGSGVTLTLWMISIRISK